MSWVYFGYEFDWGAGEKEFKRAISLKPDYAPAHEYYAWLLAAQGRFAEAVAEANRARELAPISGETNRMAGLALYLAHANDQAAVSLRKALELDPNDWFARVYLGLTYEAKGDLRSAMREYQAARKMQTDFPWPLAELGRAYALSGRRSEAEQALREMENQSKKSYVPAYNFAEIYAGLGDKEHALDSLERAFEDHSMILTEVKVDPELASLRSDLRFKSLLQRMGLPE